MKAVILAAGIGARLGGPSSDPGPKVLLRFGGKTLLQRHLEILQSLAVREVVVATGYRSEEVESELVHLGACGYARPVFNPDYTEGSIVTLWSLREELKGSGPVVLMDADVLYHPSILERTLFCGSENVIPFDRDFEPGDEPFKVWTRDARIVDFRKWSSVDHDMRGEWVGFIRLSANSADKLIAQTQLYIKQARRQDPYEEALRDIILSADRNEFGTEDISGLPWIEIDFPHDVERASNVILPRISGH